MGAFLDKPVTDKHSGDDENDKLKCGYSSMQGWRIDQEDAHNCILSYDKDTAFFAVYDGHGGREVSEYCSQKLPQFLKESEMYKQADIDKALVEGFLEFDRTICTPEVLVELKKLENLPQEANNGEDSDVEENVDSLYEEAAMPIEDVIEKYRKIITESRKGNKPEEEEKEDKSNGASSSKADCTSSEAGSSKESVKTVEVNDEVTSSSSEALTYKSISEAKGKGESLESPAVESSTKKSVPDSSDSKEAAAVIPKEESKSSGTVLLNGETSEDQSESDISSSGQDKESKKSDETVENKDKDKQRQTAEQIYKKWLQFEVQSEDEDSEEENESFEEENQKDASSEEEEEEEPVKSSLEEAETVEEEEEQDDEDDEFDSGFDGPGYRSGCTAVVSLLRGNELYVANIGDSRCIVCRDGKAVKMSEDHKPKDKPEKSRIVKAGGRVYDDRINNGLNLSRAFGDFSYKQNKELSDKEQMVIALPDIRKLTIEPGKDEFMILACDGIWNCKKNQEVIDFLRPKVLACDDNEKLSKAAESLIDQCFDSYGPCLSDGNDNMTVIIVKFKTSKPAKRPISPVPDSPTAKRKKSDEKDVSTSTAAS